MCTPKSERRTETKLSTGYVCGAPIETQAFGVCSWHFLHLLGSEIAVLTIHLSTRIDLIEISGLESEMVFHTPWVATQTMMNLNRTEILMRIINGLFRRLTNSTDVVDADDSL